MGSIAENAKANLCGSPYVVVTGASYDIDAAAAHAELLAHVRRSGSPRGAHDLIIAATGLATGRTIVTADHAAFDSLPGVDVRSHA